MYQIVKLSHLVFLSLYLLSCAPPPGAETGAAENMSPTSFIFGSVYFFLLAFFVYWSLVLRPNELKQKQHEEFVKELKKNQLVLTSGGIIGKVLAIKADFVSVEIAPNVKIKVKAESLSEYQETKDKSEEVKS